MAFRASEWWLDLPLKPMMSRTMPVKKLKSKNLDLIIANDLLQQGAGFGTDTNSVIMIERSGGERIPDHDKGRNCPSYPR